MNRNPSINSIAVFSGSNFGSHEDYIEQAKKLGQAIAERGQTMVYGGTTKGLMGVVADAALDAGGVRGVRATQSHAPVEVAVQHCDEIGPVNCKIAGLVSRYGLYRMAGPST